MRNRCDQIDKSFYFKTHPCLQPQTLFLYFAVSLLHTNLIQNFKNETAKEVDMDVSMVDAYPVPGMLHDQVKQFFFLRDERLRLTYSSIASCVAMEAN